MKRKVRYTSLYWHFVGLACWCMFGAFFAGCILLTEGDLTKLFAWIWGGR